MGLYCLLLSLNMSPTEEREQLIRIAETILLKGKKLAKFQEHYNSLSGYDALTSCRENIQKAFTEICRQINALREMINKTQNSKIEQAANVLLRILQICSFIPQSIEIRGNDVVKIDGKEYKKILNENERQIFFNDIELCIASFANELDKLFDSIDKINEFCNAPNDQCRYLIISMIIYVTSVTQITNWDYFKPFHTQKKCIQNIQKSRLMKILKEIYPEMDEDTLSQQRDQIIDSAHNSLHQYLTSIYK